MNSTSKQTSTLLVSNILGGYTSQYFSITGQAIPQLNSEFDDNFKICLVIIAERSKLLLEWNWMQVHDEVTEHANCFSSVQGDGGKTRV